MSASEATPLINMKNVRFGYGERLIIDGLSLNVRKGEIVALMGGSGSGKTTLLGLLGGRIQPKCPDSRAKRALHPSPKNRHALPVRRFVHRSQRL